MPDDFRGSLLDVPCGTLNLTINKYRNISQIKITCLDYPSDMLDIAKERIAKHGLFHIFLMQGDISNFPFDNDTFYAILSMNGFHVFPNKDRRYTETAHVLKPGSMFLACFYIKGEYNRSDFVVNSILAKKAGLLHLSKQKTKYYLCYKTIIPRWSSLATRQLYGFAV